MSKPAVRQITAVATDAPRQERSTTTGFLGFGNPNSLERKRLEIECGPGGDHDTPYRFTLPTSTPQLLAWTHLQTRVRVGELEPRVIDEMLRNGLMASSKVQIRMKEAPLLCTM